jgi:hypothetical protein
MKVYRIVLTCDVWADNEDDALEICSMDIDGVVTLSAEVDSEREDN